MKQVKDIDDCVEPDESRAKSEDSKQLNQEEIKENEQETVEKE